MKQLLKCLILFLIGGALYITIEIGWRGYSHWTMFLLGGLCFVCIGMINELFEWEVLLLKQALIGAVLITLLEFLTGCIINIKLGWNIWDYSNVPYNLLGQICLPFFFIWILIATVGIILDDYLRYWMFQEKRPYYRLI